MDRIDGKGVHPTIRPRTFHSKSKILKRRKLIKVITLFLPTDERLGKTNMSFGHFDSKEEDIVLNKLIELGVFGSYETLEEPMYGGEIVCGGMGDYSMNHADPSRPPPKHGWVHKIMRHAAVLLSLMMLVWTTACKPCNCDNPCTDDPTPDPVPTDTIPTDTIPSTPEPTYPDTIIVPWDMNGNPPSEDTILFYRDKPGVKAFVFDLEEISPEMQQDMAYWWWRAYRKARDDLYARHELAPNQSVSARGTLYAANFWDGNPYGPGTLVSDSTDLANLGLKWEYINAKQRAAAQNMIGRKILGESK